MAAFTKALTLQMRRTPLPVDERMFGPIRAKYEASVLIDELRGKLSDPM
jgi:hypothetical protein